ncbi:MAG TPA: hypothetical protein VD962_03290 [Rubricoccaceae bacterium]|nr:hypothetical protein [Rubricoccaceae bacterium]
MRVVRYTFEQQDVVLDFHHFEGCTFRRCRVHYFGYGPVMLVDCAFEACSWGFDGPAAAAVRFMTDLYQMGGGARELIEQTFENIRSGVHPGQNSPPTVN